MCSAPPTFHHQFGLMCHPLHLQLVCSLVCTVSSDCKSVDHTLAKDVMLVRCGQYFSPVVEPFAWHINLVDLCLKHNLLGHLCDGDVGEFADELKWEL